MSLDATRLAAALLPGIESAFVTAGATVPGALTIATSLASAIATAVVAEVTANASVLPTALVAPATGGPVTGTGKVA